MSDEEDKKISLIDEKGNVETITLADLAGIDMDDVTEKRGESLPKGVFVFEVDQNTPPHLAVIGEGDKAKGAAVVKTKVIDVVAVSDPDFKASPDTLIGKFHQETFFLTSLDGLGYLKAFLKDIGAPYNKDLKTMLFNSAGTRFQAPIAKKKDKDDADKVYTNFDRSKLKPVSAPPADKVPNPAA